MTDESLVFELRPSIEDDRPVIAFDDPANESIDWLQLDEIAQGERPVADYQVIHLVVRHPDATLWGFYTVPGGLGLISTEAVEQIGRSAFRLYNLLPARLNDAEYYFPEPAEMLSCLDLGQSEVIPFSHNSKRIKDITKYTFHKAMIPDPLLFSIPELFGLFTTPSVREAINRSGIPGFKFTPLG